MEQIFRSQRILVRQETERRWTHRLFRLPLMRLPKREETENGLLSA